MQKIYKTELVEIIIPANTTATKFQIPDQPNLREVLLMGVETFSYEITPKSVLSGTKLLSTAQLQQVYLTFQDYNGVEFNKQSPAITYKTIGNTAGEFVERDFKKFTGQKTNYPKSYIQFPVTLGNTEDLSFLMQVSYYDPSQKGSATFQKRK
jgi:hypothetical protein